MSAEWEQWCSEWALDLVLWSGPTLYSTALVENSKQALDLALWLKMSV